MNADRLRSYRFASQAQWDSCLFAQVVRDRAHEHERLRPFPSFVRQATLYESPGGHTPVVTPAGEIGWCDDDTRLHWLSSSEAQRETFLAPSAIGSAARVVATPSGFWVIGRPPEALQKYDVHSLSRLLTVNLHKASLIDIASDGRGSMLVLVEREGRLLSIRVDRGGHEMETVEFAGLAHARAFTFLRHAQRFVLLTAEPHSRLYWFSSQGGKTLFSLAISATHPCFTPVEILEPVPRQVFGSDARERVFLAGRDGDTCRDSDKVAGGTFVLIFDADGGLLGDVPIDPLDTPVTGLAATRESLYVTGRRGLLRFDPAAVVPEGVGSVHCTLITPMLLSPDREDQRRWLRAEATSRLPEGSTIEISYAAPHDTATRDRLKAIAANDSISAGQRINMLLNEPDLWRGRTVFHGTATDGAPTNTFSAKLFDIREPYLWVCITLTAAAGARLPELSELAVLYPGRTLMEHLPAMYQREEANSDNFLRGVVGVLEATTQGLDAKIGSMGQQIHPSTAPESWLDFIARWLGVPWDDGLRLEQKRAIVMRAAELTKWRGTRRGLELLLECLMPDMPRRFRVTDATADFGFAVVGGGVCAGTTLPAMLGGRTGWSAELGSQSVLGTMRLPCSGQREDGIWHLAGLVRVEIAAIGSERNTWESWLPTLIGEMIPIIARVEIRWVSTQALLSQRLDGTMVLASAPIAYLDTDAITGLARLPETETRLSAAGPRISRPLQ